MPAVALLLNGTQETIDKLNEYFGWGYGLVDRFDLGDGSFIVVVMKPQATGSNTGATFKLA